MSGEPMKIRLKPDAPLSSVKYRPIPVPFHFKQSAKRDIDRDIRMGVLQKKPQGEATTYCSQTVFTPPKCNGEPRRTIDYRDLNPFNPVHLIWFLQFQQAPLTLFRCLGGVNLPPPWRELR